MLNVRIDKAQTFRWGKLYYPISVLAIIGISIIGFDSAPHIPIIISIVLILYGIMGLSFNELQDGMVQGPSCPLEQFFIFFIGILISSWILGGPYRSNGYRIEACNSSFLLWSDIYNYISYRNCVLEVRSLLQQQLGQLSLESSSALDLSLPNTPALSSQELSSGIRCPLSDTTNLAASVPM